MWATAYSSRKSFWGYNFSKLADAFCYKQQATCGRLLIAVAKAFGSITFLSLLTPSAISRRPHVALEFDADLAAGIRGSVKVKVSLMFIVFVGNAELTAGSHTSMNVSRDIFAIVIDSEF